MTPLDHFTTSDKQTEFTLVKTPEGRFQILSNGRVKNDYTCQFMAEEKFYKLKEILSNE